MDEIIAGLKSQILVILLESCESDDDIVIQQRVMEVSRLNLIVKYLETVTDFEAKQLLAVKEKLVLMNRVERFSDFLHYYRIFSGK